MEIHEALKYARLERGYSTVDVQKATGIASQNLSRWEKKQSIPGINFCVQLAQFYGISVDELIGYPDTTERTAEQTPAVRATSETAAFLSDFSDIIREKNFVSIAKLYKAAPKELRAIALGYLIGLMSSNGINTQAVLGY